MRVITEDRFPQSIEARIDPPSRLNDALTSAVGGAARTRIATTPHGTFGKQP